MGRILALPPGRWKFSHCENKLYDIATIYARLGNRPLAYEYLEKACERKAFTQGLMFDLCWDHNDEQFKAIARRIGIMP